jgi:hypothetical protein
MVERAIQIHHESGVSCAVCGRATLMPIAQWVEFWHIGRTTVTVDAGGRVEERFIDMGEGLPVPFSRVGCSVDRPVSEDCLNPGKAKHSRRSWVLVAKLVTLQKRERAPRDIKCWEVLWLGELGEQGPKTRVPLVIIVDIRRQGADTVKGATILFLRLTQATDHMPSCWLKRNSDPLELMGHLGTDGTPW